MPGMTWQSSSRFIGRRAERSRLAAGIAESRRGGGRIFVVEGEAGIGKSRLLHEVTNSARSSGHRVLAGGCVNLHEDTAPLAPIAEALRGLAAETSPEELERLLGPAHEVLVGLLPAPIDARRAERAGPTHALPQQGLHARLVDLVARISRDRPLVLVVEDIHWADSATLDLLSLLARSVRTLPVALLLSQRTDEAEANNRLTVFVAELERLAHPEHVRLPRFTRGEVSEQVAAMRGPQAIDPALVDAVLTRSQGNPFYAEELLAAGSEAGELQATLRDVLEARLATLSSDARRVVDAAAVRSADSTEDELAAVTALDAHTLGASVGARCSAFGTC
jgi:predicted ATPase